MMSRKRRTAVLAITAAAGLCTSIAAEAGVIVKNDGSVLVGRIDRHEVTRDTVTMRWPYGKVADKGSLVVDLKDIRWFDVDADAPTLDYWQRFPNAKIDPAYRPPVFRCPKMPGKEFLPEPPDKTPLTSVPLVHKDGASEVRLRKPQGWIKTEEHGVLMLVSPVSGTGGVAPRIHVFSAPSDASSPSEQVERIRSELARLGELTIHDETGPRPVTSGFDYDLTATLTISCSGRKLPEPDSRPVMSLRHVFFRGNRTYVFCAYAHARDYAKFSILFRACLDTIEIVDAGG